MTLSDDDLSAYVARIGYSGPREATLATLREIVAGHAAAIPFENVAVLPGRGVQLDAAALVDKLVHRGRGGYCFEHNTLLLLALEALGFAVEGLAARVLWNRPEGDPTARTHMLLRVRLPEGDFLADVGFGGLTLTVPLRLEVGPQQETPHEPHRLVAIDGESELQARLNGAWIPLYRFDRARQLPVDYEMANWYTSTFPNGLFTSNLMCGRPDPDRRYALLNRNFTVRHRDGRVERRTLADAAELHAVLTRDFQGKIPAADAAAVWQRVVSRTQQS
jgi:N-hydroxyarylamine O-acetyltransferase